MGTVEKVVKYSKLVLSLHRLCNKIGDRQIDAENRASVYEYLENKKDEAEPRASKTVRTATKMELREEDNNMELPTNYTKCGLYVDWCYMRRFLAKLEGVTGTYGKLAEYSK